MARRLFSLLLSFALAGCASAPAVAESRRLPPSDQAVTPVLLSMMDDRRPARPTLDDRENTALRTIMRLVTPRGEGLRIRYEEPRLPLVQAFALASNEQLRQRLLESARWSSTTQARAEGLIGIATEGNSNHIKYFKEALLDKNLGVQFAAIEALQVWGRPEAVPYLVDAAERAWSPVIQVFAAQSLARLGDPRGRRKLLDHLQAPGWLSRAMAARYLGDLGLPEDLARLMSRISAERDNDFVLAEICVASLKLMAKQPQARPPPPPPSSSRPRPVPAPRTPFELEPLVVTAPRVRVGRNMVDVRIDNDLVRLLERLADTPPEEQFLDDFQAALGQLTTPTGRALKLRYTNLDALLVEGLAGTSNYTLVDRLETVVRTSRSARARVTALVALGYQPNRRELSLFQDALRDVNDAVRFAAVEALAAIDDDGARAVVAGAAQADPSPAVQAFAAQCLTSFGDPYGRQVLLRFLDDRDWTLRGMAVYGLGEWGEPEDYFTLLNRINGESRDFVRAETCLALLKLSKRFP